MPLKEKVGRCTTLYTLTKIGRFIKLLFTYIDEKGRILPRNLRRHLRNGEMEFDYGEETILDVISI